MKLFFLLCAFFISGIANATNYYFSSTNGDDSRTSTQAQNSTTPWKTLGKLNSFFSSLNAGDNVYFLRGDVFYGSITITKSGTLTSPITLGAYGSGADPVITGFSVISSWTSAGSNLWESATAASSLNSCNIISINGVNVAMGRMPKTGFWTISSTNGNNITDATNLNSSSKNWTGAQVVLRKHRWVMDKFPITAASGSSISFSNSGDDVLAGWGYFIQNDIKALTAQNDWAYNSATKKITIYSSTSPSNVQVPTVDVAVNINNNNYITFDNLSFTGYNNTGINTTSSAGIIVQNGSFYFIGKDAIYGYPNSNKLKVITNDFKEINSRGIHAGSSSNAYINGNTLTNIGNLAGMGGNADDSYTAIISQGDYGEVFYNSVSNAGYIGVRWDGNGTVIKNNFINTTNYIKDDGGGIYCFPSQLGAVAQSFVQRTVSNNIVINSIGAVAGGTPSSNGSEAMGIYNDGTSPNVDYLNNTIANAQLGLFLNGAHECNTTGNTIYNCSRGIYLLNFNSAIGITNLKVNNNIFVARTASQYPAYYEPGGTSMPSSFQANNNVYARPVDDNATIWRDQNGTNVYNTLAQWKSYTGQESTSTKSPVTTTNVNDLRLEYNETASSKAISLGATYMDAKGVSYPGTITLAPYTSAVLIKSSAGNVSPVANAGADKTITLPTNTVTVTGTGTDPDGTISGYLWTKISGPMGGAISASSSATTNITALIQGVYQFELKVTDNGGATAKDTVVVSVNAATVNVAPLANAGSNQGITLPVNSVTLTGSGNDTDGTIVSYAWTKISGPTSGTVTNATSATTTVTALVQGLYWFELKVTDNAGAIGKDTVYVTVNASGSNQSPTANAGVDKVISLPTNSISLTGIGTDPDGTISSYSWTKISGPISFTISTPVSANTTVTGLVQGVYLFELKVTDNAGAIGKDTVQVSVNVKANVLPTANAGIDQTISLPTAMVTLSGSGSDPDGTIVSYNWIKISGPAGNIISTASSAITTVTGLLAGTYVFQVTVTDNNGGTATDNVQVTVNPLLPTATKIINVNVYGGSNPLNDSRWNNWKSVAKTKSAYLKYEDGTTSAAKAVLSAQTGISDNGTGYASTATSCPSEVLRYYVANTAQRTLTISGLSSTKQYTFKFYASSKVTTNGTSFMIGTSSDDIMTDNNIDHIAQIVNVAPDSKGSVVVKLLSIYTYNYLAGFTIIEQTGSVSGKSVVVQSDTAEEEEPQPAKVEDKVLPEAAIPVSIIAYPNPFVESIKIKIDGSDAGNYQVFITDISGRVIWRKLVNKSKGSYIETVNAANFGSGMYIIQVISPDQKKASFKLVKVN